MIYRCPYCQQEMGAEKLPACPSCGRKMNYKERRTPAERRADKLKIKMLEREALQKRSAFDSVATSNFLRNPRVLLWAVFILALLAFMIYKASQQSDPTEDIRRARMQIRVDTIAIALARYHFHTGQWPPEHVGLNALIRDDGSEGWFGPYITDHRQLPLQEMNLDTWQQPYVYRLNEDGKPILFSMGPDMTADTADDIHANPAAFKLTDMRWTNEWVRAEERLPIRVNIMK